MKILLSGDPSSFDVANPLFLVLLLALIGMILQINRITNLLQKRNEYSVIQIRLLKKMLINQGTPIEEIDEIIEKGNKNTKTQVNIK